VRTLRQTLRAYVKMAHGDQPIYFEYPVTPTPRYGSGRPPHLQLHLLIDRGRARYSSTLTSFLDFEGRFSKIALGPEIAREPCWNNGSLPALDSMALYALLGHVGPKRFVEIGSGHSTKFAKRAITDLGLSTQITSIDPLPRADIDPLCDHVIREPLERVDPSWSGDLESGDILFVDGSHRCFENSDVAVFFLDILPRLHPGVIVEIHDIFLPYDYPSPWNVNLWSEQYLLASWLLSGGDHFEIILPNAFISQDPELRSVLEPLWTGLGLKVGLWPGVSFWVRTR